MPNAYINNIREQQERINKESRFMEDEVLPFMVNLRQHLEAEDLKDTYKRTMLYCNWSLHTKLDKRGLAQEVLDDLTQVLSDILAGSGGKYHGQSELDEIIKDVNETLSLRELRREIREILKAEGIQSILFDTYNGWKLFVGQLARLLMEKPIQRRTQPSGFSRWIESLKIVAEAVSTQKDLAGVLASHILLIEMTTNKPKDITFVMELELGECPEDFL